MIKLKSKEIKEQVKVDTTLKDTTISEYLGAIFGLIEGARNNLDADLLDIINSHYGKLVIK